MVPNPETSQLPLVREFERDADDYVGAEAFSFEGLASYLHLRLCVEALRRASKLDGPRLAEAIEGLGILNLGAWEASGSSLDASAIRARTTSRSACIRATDGCGAEAAAISVAHQRRGETGTSAEPERHIRPVHFRS